MIFFTGPQKLAVDLDEMAVAGGAAGTVWAMNFTVTSSVPPGAIVVPGAGGLTSAWMWPLLTRTNRAVPPSI